MAVAICPSESNCCRHNCANCAQTDMMQKDTWGESCCPKQIWKSKSNFLSAFRVGIAKNLVLPQRNLRFVFPQPWIFVTDFDGALRMEFCSRCGKTLIFSIPTVNALMDHTILQVRHWKTQKFSCIPYKRDCSKNAETLPRFPGSTEVYVTPFCITCVRLVAATWKTLAWLIKPTPEHSSHTSLKHIFTTVFANVFV